MIRSVRLLLQLLKLVHFHQLVLSLLAVRGALQLQVFKFVSVHEGSHNYEGTKSSVLGRNSPLLQIPLWHPACYPASEGYSLSATGPDGGSKELLYKKVKQIKSIQEDLKIFFENTDTHLRPLDKLTAKKSGLSWMAMARSGRADLDFPIARYTAARL